MTFIIEDKANQYILKQKLGSGATCECYLGKKSDDKTPELFAIKIFPQKYYEYYLNEISVLSKLNSKNIIKLYEYGQGIITPALFNNINNDINNDNQIIYYQVMELAENGELKDYVNGTDTRIPEKISSKIFVKIVNIVKYLHENNIAHCDLKPENILLGKNYSIKLSDFGFSQEFNREKGNLLHKKLGTPNYSSPDIRLAFTKGYDGIKNDIFSLGVLLFVITIGNFPFESPTYSDEKYKFIIKGNYNRFWEFFNYIDISEEFKDLINHLLSLNPTKRLSTEEILRHIWIIKHLGLNYNVQDDNFDEEIREELEKKEKYL